MTCVHHWVCEGSASRAVHATCKHCHATRVFNDSGDLADGWTGTTSEYVRADPSRTRISRQSGDTVRALPNPKPVLRLRWRHYRR